MYSIITGIGRRRWFGVVLVGLVAFPACDKVPLLAPRQSTITLSTASNVVQANGVTEIRATVLEESGTPVHNGTTVMFTTTLGTLSPSEARTENGVARVQFIANGQSGLASVRAASGGATSEAIELSVGAAATSRVSLTASPTSVPSTGGATTISATVVDASGNAVTGVPVTFTTTAGSFSSSVATTDASGTARTTLTTNRDASVTASAGGTTSSAITVSTAARPTVSLSVTSGTTPTEGGITTFSITANPGTNGEPIQNVVIDYGDGTSDDLGSVTGTISVQHIYGSDGTFTPTARATDTSGQTATATTVIVVQPILVSISAQQSATNPQTFNFTANVSPAGATVASYEWTFGDGTSVTTSSNTTTRTYTSSGNKTVRVTARTSTNRTASGSTTVSVP